MEQTQNTPLARKRYSFLIPVAVMLVAIVVLAGFALSRMESYITRAGEQSMTAVAEQMEQSYDLQLGRIYERLGWVESSLFRGGDRSVSLAQEREQLISAAGGDQYRLVFMRDNGQVMTLAGDNIYLDVQASSLLTLRQGDWIAQTVSWEDGSARQTLFLAAIPCKPYKVDGTSFSALGMLI
ncbi:MAG: hypothetical protein ACI36V_05405, partial [Coriobacteriales bacterium]